MTSHPTVTTHLFLAKRPSDIVPSQVPLFIQFGSVLAAWQAYKQMRIALKMTNGAVSSLEQLVLWWQ